jgi:hypothetical protein
LQPALDKFAMGFIEIVELRAQRRREGRSRSKYESSIV